MQILKRVSFIVFFFLGMGQVLADQSMRRCMLLPISDSVNGAIGFKVFEELEYYLRNSHWCYYRSNSDILDILKNYQNNLHDHLQNKDVLKILGEKTRAGSLLRIHLQSDVKGMEISLNVLGHNGEDLLFKEKTRIESSDITQISQVLKNWLDSYEKGIPYDARIVGVLGDQFTVDIGREFGVQANQTAKIVRVTEKKKHPLLQEVIEWETEPIADAVIFHVVDLQSQGRVMTYQGQKKLMQNDWLILTKTQETSEAKRPSYSERDKEYSFGRIGSLSLALSVGSGSHTVLNTNQNIKKMGGSLIGADIGLEIWATRNYWIGFDLTQRFGTYKPKEGAMAVQSNSVNHGSYKLKLGYKYLPLGFFYGPQLDGYIGYARYSYGFDTSVVDSAADVRFQGLLLGTKGTVPFLNKYRAYLKLDFIFKPGYREDVAIFGAAESRSHFNLGFGSSYEHTPAMSFYAGFDYTQSAAEFIAPERELKLKESSFKLGTTFTF